jgi:hypothetical protein
LIFEGTKDHAPEKSLPVPELGVSATIQYWVPAVMAKPVVKFAVASLQQV